MAKNTANGRITTANPGPIVGDSEMAQRIRAYNWQTTGLNTIDTWPQSLVTAVNIMLQSPVPIVMLWGKDGIMIYNDAYSVFAGGRHPRLLGSKVVEGWPEVADFNRNVMKHGLQGKTLSYKDQQLTLYRNDIPEEVWMDLSYSPVIDESGKPGGVWAIVVETTQRVLAEQRQKQAEEALKAEQERLHTLLMQAPAMIAVLHGPELIFEMANPMYVNTVASNRDIVGKPLVEAMPELAGQEVIGILQDVLRTGTPYAGQLSVKLDRYNTGQLQDAYFNLVYQPVSSVPGNEPDSIFVHAVDITDQVLGLRRTEELNAQLEAVFESMPDGVYIAQGDEITRINQRGAEALGFKNPADVPRKLSDLYATLAVHGVHDGKDYRIEDSTLGNALRGISVQHVVEVSNPITGEKQTVRTAGAPIRNKEGTIIGAVAINNDLTEQYRMQEKMQKEVLRRRLLAQKAKLLKQQNVELTKLNATKNEFIALTSHQLRTPATGVKQYVAMLMQGYAGPITPEQEQFLERAYESNERQLHIIEDILRVAKVDMGKTVVQKQDTDILALVRNVLSEQRDRFSEHALQTVTKLPDKPLIARVDGSQLHMAIGNIVDNAIKYTPDGKRITVSLQKLEGSNELELQVSDQGVGIAADDQDKLFQKFSRIPNPRSIMVGGTGLGLYWTQRIIELHGGTITVRSTLGKGTTFVIRLPIRP
jgi:signal transduction histidine kinase